MWAVSLVFGFFAFEDFLRQIWKKVRNLNRWNFRYFSVKQNLESRIYCIGDLAALGAIGSGGSLLYLTVTGPKETFAHQDFEDNVSQTTQG